MARFKRDKEVVGSYAKHTQVRQELRQGRAGLQKECGGAQGRVREEVREEEHYMSVLDRTGHMF